mmetsp:Transcript_12934/g.32345  ORF Transcript_12934/g.32345 Transcript_12934/m.32345 type:complete len:224 (-) Transcript_12934:186-857(-)
MAGVLRFPGGAGGEAPAPRNGAGVAVLLVFWGSWHARRYSVLRVIGDLRPAARRGGAGVVLHRRRGIPGRADRENQGVQDHRSNEHIQAPAGPGVRVRRGDRLHEQGGPGADQGDQAGGPAGGELLLRQCRGPQHGGSPDVPGPVRSHLRVRANSLLQPEGPPVRPGLPRDHGGPAEQRHYPGVYCHGAAQGPAGGLDRGAAGYGAVDPGREAEGRGGRVHRD